MSETMMTKHEIEIPDLPDGWRAVAYRNANTGEFVIGSGGVEQVRGSITKTITRYLIVEKIKPRRIVFEATNEFRQAVKGDWVQFCDCTDNFQRWGDLEPSTSKYKIWRVVEE